MKLLIILSGIWIGLYLSHDYLVYILISIILILFILKRFKVKTTLMFIGFIFIGYLTSFISFDFTKQQYSGLVTESKENYYILSSTFEKLYVYEKDNDKEIGDIIRIDGYKQELSFNVIESGFDFKNYLNDKGVKYELKVKNETILFSSFFKIKAIQNNFLNKFEKDVSPLVGSMLFGLSDEHESKDLLTSLHLYRLFNVGGLFVNCFIYFFAYIYSLKFNKNKSKILSLITLSPFLLLSINKFSVFRILFINILTLVNIKFLKSKFSYLDILSFSALIILIFDYHLAFQDGFILGYLISIFAYLINNSFSYIKKKYKNLILFIFIFLFFIPFEVDYYHEISFLSPFLSAILSPIFILVNFLNLLCLYGIPLHFIPTFLLKGLINGLDFLNLNTLSIYSSSFPLFFGFIYECILLGIFYYRSIQFKLILNPLIVIFVSLLLIKFLPINNLYEKQIYFINVGQGDSTLIRNKDKTILIDTGGNLYNDIALNCLIPFFKKEKIYDIDYLIITHDDYDHSGAKESLKENFTIKNELNYSSFPLTIDDINIQNLNPYSSFIDKGENDSSLVLYFNFLNLDFLLMGDASKVIENNILNEVSYLNVDILKVGHHGSSTSTSYNFIKTIKPKEAIISCGKNNKYGHPSIEVINILSYFDVNIRRTDIEGTIVYN